jgi:alkylation response protein AidB-like acyl-CoA dehydrogenase
MRREWGKMLHRAGWLGSHWPEEYGGRGFGIDEQVAFVEVLVKAGAPEPLNANGIGAFAPALMRYGTEEQKRRWLQPMISHEEIWCQGFSEPEAGSDLRSLRTSAVRDGDEWRITGQKVWTSYAQYASKCYLLARVPDHGITMFVIKMQQPTITVVPLRNLAGTSEFCEVFFDGTVVPVEDVVGEVGSGWAIASFALANERSTNLAQRALQLGREFEVIASLLGGASADALHQPALIDAFVRTRVVESMVRRIQATVDAGDEVGAIASMAKITWSEAHQKQLGLLLDLAGSELAVGRDRYAVLQRALLHARAETIYGGTSEIQRNLIASSLGLPSDRGR